MKHKYSYPSQYWRFGYLLALAPSSLALLMLVNYVLVPNVSLRGLLYTLVFFISFSVYTLWAANRYRLFYSNITVTDLGLIAPITESERPFSRIRKAELTNWRDIREVAVFAEGSFDAVRMGKRSAGLRVYVPKGYVVILNCLPGFETLVNDIESHVADAKAVR